MSGKLNTKRISVILKLISEFNATSNKIPGGFFFCGTRQTNSKIHIERHRAWNSQEKNNCWRKRPKKNIIALFRSEFRLGSFHRQRKWWHPLQCSRLEIPGTAEPGGLQSMGPRRVGHDWATSLSLFTFHFHAFLPGESQGWGSLVGCRLWGHTELDMTEATQQQPQFPQTVLMWPSLWTRVHFCWASFIKKGHSWR